MNSTTLLHLIYRNLHRGRREIPVLIYHRIRDAFDPLRPQEQILEDFVRHMELVAGIFRPLTLCEAVERAAGGELPKDGICITFDDGYKELTTNVLPVFERLGLKGTFFITTGQLEGRPLWTDRVTESLRHGRGRLDLGAFGLGSFEPVTVEERRHVARTIIEALKKLPRPEREAAVEAVLEGATAGTEMPAMIDEEGIKALWTAGMEIGGHTHNHPILPTVEDAVAVDEIRQNKDILEAITGQPLRGFAYPNGAYEPRHVEMLQGLGFHYAATTRPGGIGPGTDPFEIRRATPWDASRLKFVARLALMRF